MTLEAIDIGGPGLMGVSRSWIYALDDPVTSYFFSYSESPSDLIYHLNILTRYKP